VEAARSSFARLETDRLSSIPKLTRFARVVAGACVGEQKSGGHFLLVLRADTSCLSSSRTLCSFRIYEEFVETQGTDVKMYTVGPEYGHAEARCVMSNAIVYCGSVGCYRFHFWL